MPLKPPFPADDRAPAGVSQLSDAQREAVSWLVRLEDTDMSPEDFQALCVWLEASSENQEAFDDAERATELAARALEAAADESLTPPAAHMARIVATPKFFTPMRTALAGGLMVLGIAGAVIGLRPQSVETQTFVTQKGQRLQTTLSDGTQIHLNSDTRLTVALSKDARKLELQQGEVFVEVAAHKDAPLSLRAGDQLIRDVGTQFNVARLNRNIRVSVRQGLVDVTTDANASGAAAQQRLRPGDEMLHREGSNAVRLIQVDPETVTAWREGRAVYRDTALSDVVADLNRYVTTPIVVDEATGNLRLNAIIVLDEEDKIVARLTAFLPVEAVRKDGEIRLVPARPAGRRLPSAAAAAADRS